MSLEQLIAINILLRITEFFFPVNSQSSSYLRFCQLKYSNEPKKNNERRGEQVQTREKEMECHICCYKFSSNRISNLKRHLKLHTFYKRMQCSVCHRTYANYSNFIRHLSRRHEGYENSVMWTVTTDGARERPKYQK